MTVCRTEITQVQSLEDVLRLTRQYGFQVIAKSPHPLRLVVIQYMPFNQPLIRLPPPVVIPLTRCDVHQILGDSPSYRVDGHVVVVQYNQQIILIHRRVVQPLKRQSTRHRPITYHRHHSRLLFTLHFPLSTLHCNLDSQRSGNRVARMPRHERIVLTLHRTRERCQSLELSVRMEPVPTTRQYLMRISLMTHVPHHLIHRRIEHIVYRHRQLYRTQRRRQVTRIMAQLIDNKIPQLRAHHRQRRHRQRLQIRRTIDAI